MKPAVGTPLAIIAVNCIGGLIGQLRYVNFDWRLTLGFLLMEMAGMGAGAALAKCKATVHCRLAARLRLVRGIAGLSFGCAESGGSDLPLNVQSR